MEEIKIDKIGSSAKRACNLLRLNVQTIGLAQKG